MNFDLTLYYFDCSGKGEAIRLVLKYAGIPFENYIFVDNPNHEGPGYPYGEDFLKMKETGELMFGQVPALKVVNKENGETHFLTQSAAILRFIGNISPKSELIPSCPIQAARADAICDQEADAFQAIRCCIYQERFGFDKIDKETLEKCKTEINETIIPKHFEQLEKQIESGKTIWLAGTDKPTIADFVWASWLPIMIAGWTGKKFDLTDKYPKLKAMCDNFYELKAVKEWYKTNEYKLWF